VNERVDQLEIKVAYLEQANSELSDELFRQRQEIASLRVQMAVLADRLRDAQAQEKPTTIEEETPPHY
jgi:uncharacterized coiled-coil protein SlyX